MDLSCPGRPLATVDNTHTVCVETGIATGTVVLAIELLNGPPADLVGTRNWEVISEVSFETVSSYLGPRTMTRLENSTYSRSGPR